jgi:RimJ/RimL family protein N-acetyltransferase
MTPYLFETRRLGFGLWSESDLPLTLSLWGDPAVAPAEVEGRLALEMNNYRKYRVQYFPLYLLEDGAFVGCCGLRPYGAKKDVFELGVHLLEPFWHKGIAREAAHAMIHYAFSFLHATQLRAGHHPDNTSSQQLLLRLGFQYIGDEFYPPTGRMHPAYRLDHIPDIKH